MAAPGSEQIQKKPVIEVFLHVLITGFSLFSYAKMKISIDIFKPYAIMNVTNGYLAFC